MATGNYAAVKKHRQIIGAGSKDEAKKKFIKDYVEKSLEVAMEGFSTRSTLVQEIAREKQSLRFATRNKASAEAELAFLTHWERKKAERLHQRKVENAAKRVEFEGTIKSTYEHIYHHCPRYMDKFTVCQKDRTITCWHKNAEVYKERSSGEFVGVHSGHGRIFSNKNKLSITYKLFKERLPFNADENEIYSLTIHGQGTKGSDDTYYEYYENDLIAMEHKYLEDVKSIKEGPIA